MNAYVEKLERLKKQEIRNKNWIKVKSIQFKIDNSNMTTTKRGVISKYLYSSSNNNSNSDNNDRPNRKERREAAKRERLALIALNENKTTKEKDKDN